MSGKHDHKPFEGHMHDFEAHIRAVEEDLEYYRAKRFEPRIIYLIRRGVVTFSDLLKARVALKRNNQFFKPRKPQGKNIEARVRYLEEWLDEYVKGIALVSARAVETMDMVTEDNRKERGDYDDFFKIKKKEHHGTLEERMVNVEQDLKDYQELLEVFVQALIKRGWSTREQLQQRWRQLHEERPWAGGVIVAKAWTDPTFKQALLSTGREALREMGVHQGESRQAGGGGKYRQGSQRHCLYVVLLLSVRHSWRYAVVVQARELPDEDRAKSPRLRAGYVRVGGSCR